MSYRKKTFTLIEMIVVLSIIGILMGMVLPATIKAKKRAKYTRWLAYNSILNRDSDTVINYNFQNKDLKVKYNNTLCNALPNGAIACSADGYVGTDYDGILINNPEWVKGGGRWGFNYALQFDGLNDYILVPGTKALNFDPAKDNFTVCMWVNFDVIKGLRTLFGKAGWNKYAQYDTFLWKKRIYADSGTMRSGWKTPKPETGKWYHIVLLNENSLFQVYMNGQPMTKKVKAKGKKNVFCDANFLIGAVCKLKTRKKQSYYIPKYFFKGRIDEVLLFARALNDGEIKNLYEMGNP